MKQPNYRRPHEQAHSPAKPSSQSSPPAQPASPAAKFFRLFGPGFITGASDDDPTSVGTTTVAGASYGYATLWTIILGYPMMVMAQYLSAKIGLVAGHGVARLLKQHYSSRLLYPLIAGLVIANTITVGADLQAVAAAINMFVPVPIGILMIPVALIILALLFFGSYRLIARVFKWLALFLCFYIAAALLAHPNSGDLLRGTFIPTIRWDKQYLAVIVAILGTSVTPYMFFWQSSEQVEEQRAIGAIACWRQGTCEADLKYATADVMIGIAFTQVVMYFLILAPAATLYVAGKHNVQTAVEAAQALAPLAGHAASVLFAAGLIGSGFLAIPVVSASSAYAVGDVFGWKSTLNAKPRQAKAFYALIAVSLLVALGVNLIGWDPIAALVWASVIDGFMAPPLLAMMLLITNNKRLMAGRVNAPWLNALGWLTVLVISAACIALVISSLH